MSGIDAQDPDGAGDAPCAVGLLASTLMLMTGVAVPAADTQVDAQTLRRMQARRIVSNLCILRVHSALPPGLRQVAAQLHARWVSAAQPAPAVVAAHTEDDRPLLH